MEQPLYTIYANSIPRCATPGQGAQEQQQKEVLQGKQWIKVLKWKIKFTIFFFFGVSSPFSPFLTSAIAIDFYY